MWVFVFMRDGCCWCEQVIFFMLGFFFYKVVVLIQVYWDNKDLLLIIVIGDLDFLQNNWYLFDFFDYFLESVILYFLLVFLLLE